MRTSVTLPAVVLVTSVLLAACGNDAVAPAKVSGETAVASESQASSQDKSKAGTETVKEDYSVAVAGYRAYAVEQIDAFVKETEKFTDAVKAGELEKAKALYAPARMYYERIEPVAEALGDLDPNIDARDGDVEAADWRGFHRIEKALWEDNTTDGMKEYADTLLSDAKLLRAKVETMDIDAGLMVTGAVELLNEVSSSKVTGEEERYSHTDLYDFAANVEGAREIYNLLKDDLAAKDKELNQQIADRFAALEKELAPFKDGDGYVSYKKLKDEDVRKLSQNLDALAEPLSNMGQVLGV
ncbi:iron uptake system protein EfeO [Paenibacillus silvae]|uniref:EfeM/EfeO family lipoprotein n=1 Tax=Paenibacillus silvae TaxID=1325358 RepID=A0A2W6QDJ6_9BACL|nr:MULTISPECIES: iron uptake system protein EfeO [Paenibacillus]MCK6075879.1 EfeM/EfeO family lipoprotein [Paenibacillus silvae]MCK6150268.1 EfeM/EfeO family lipoprotein [Paenibacillus silvae]MCK6268566.1 EfeM/EfeO family lipoprotein [Paenibacillus silvae]PZT55303.1 EfeM/EfeO family lipoprotein [Paenibacillus silvae]